MKILYIGYWNIADPLTVATVFPNLEVLQKFDFVSKVVFVNTERESSDPKFCPAFVPTKITYQPIFSRNFKFTLLNKIWDFVYFPREITRLVHHHGIDVVIARGAPAGSLAYLSFRKTGVPFIVESFEPHAEYMRENGVWSRIDFRYLYQRKWEEKQKRFALGLMPVSDAYRTQLVNKGVSPNNAITVPCAVNPSLFFVDGKKRMIMREKYNIADDEIVGVYAGKFGGLYLKEATFTLYRAAFHYFKSFFLVILAPPEYHDWIWQQLQRVECPLSRVIVEHATHQAVPDYLNMSDFGFATYKSRPSHKFLSPVKLAEFWACGLPVVLTKGTGDESSFVEEETAGVLFDPDDMNVDSLHRLFELLARTMARRNIRTTIARLALSARSPGKAADAYRHLLDS